MVPESAVSRCTEFRLAASPERGDALSEVNERAPEAQQLAGAGADWSVSPGLLPSIYEDRGAYGNHLIEHLDVLVPKPDAPVTDRAANALRLVGAV